MDVACRCSNDFAVLWQVEDPPAPPPAEAINSFGLSIGFFSKPM